MDALAETTSAVPDIGAGGLKFSSHHRGLFSALCHEMCRPLISLHAGFDLLLAGCEGPISPGQREQIQTLRTQCNSLIGMSRSFLEYAGPSRPARALDLGPFRLGALLVEADRQFSGPSRARGIEWSCQLDGEDGAVVTDLASFQQILGEVVANALAHTQDGGRIRVSGRIEADGWCVTVMDDGQGIPPQALGRVFEPLICGGTAPDRPAEARHGMGLAVCRETVGRLRGEILLHSAPERGTTVSLRFPACLPPEVGPA